MTASQPMSTADKLARVAALIRAANAAAIAADPGEACDGGTCNCDTPTIRLRGVRRAAVESLTEVTGVRVSLISDRGYWAGRYFVNTAKAGQARRREVMMEAAMRVLREGEGVIPGYSALGYYQMD